jgi:hypothetical protein
MESLYLKATFINFSHIDPLFYHFDRRRESDNLWKTKKFLKQCFLGKREMKVIVFSWKNAADIARKI